MNVRLEYWNGTEWVDCSSFQNERIAWLVLRGDDLNYRTIDTTKPVLTVLTDKSSDTAKEQQKNQLDTTGQVYTAMMSRLIDIAVERSWEHKWAEVIDSHGLGYEVAMSSGLTVESVKELSDENFLSLVNEGMHKWDI